MKDISEFRADVLAQNQRTSTHDVNSLLLLYEQPRLFVGDNCIEFDKLRMLRSVFKNAALHISWENQRYNEVYTSLLKENPHIDSYTNRMWQDIDFPAYDVIICVTPEESRLLTFLFEKYFASIPTTAWRPAIFSMSNLVLFRDSTRIETIFPGLDQLSIIPYTHQPNVYLTPGERAWGNQWLEERGMSPSEKLIILIDSTTSRSKLLSIDVYFKLVDYLLRLTGIKILIFDDANTGKAEFYKEWLGAEKFSRMIFTNSLTLREDFCIIASTYTKLIFGPCSGLLHCASGIYSTLAAKGLPASGTPLMITYTGKYDRPGDHAEMWWGTSPLIKCLILRDHAGKKEIALLSELPENQKKEVSDLLTCKEYTFPQLLERLTALIQEKERKDSLA